jgi:pyruvate ferredoxin oxidoreductase gamma subunit
VLELKIQGRGGQGAQLAGEVLATVFFRGGKFVQAFSSYGGARRGTPVSTFIRVDDRPIQLRCDIEEPDAVICFDATLMGPALLAGTKPETVVLVNSARPPEDFAELGFSGLATVDALAIARSLGLGRIVNSAVLGAFARVIGEPDIDFLAGIIREVSPSKQEQNAQSAYEGYRLVRLAAGEPAGSAGSGGSRVERCAGRAE